MVAHIFNPFAEKSFLHIKRRFDFVRIFPRPLIRILQTYNPFKGLVRIIPGCFALVRYCFISDNISVCLSMFSTPSFTPRMGQCNDYEIVISNATARSLTVRLLVEVSLKKISKCFKARCVYLEKKVFLAAHKAQAVGFVYDWVAAPRFVIDNVPLAPDSLWQGAGCEPALYRIDALLLDSDGRTCDKLTLIQELVR